jgi:hypothetical protein
LKYRGELKSATLAHPITTIGRADLNRSAANHQFITGIHAFCGGLAVG